MPSAAPTARLEARISTELHAMLKRAAEIQGRSLTDFVVSAVQEAAQRAIEQGEVVRLSLADSERFAQSLLSPPDPSPAALLERIARLDADLALVTRDRDAAIAVAADAERRRRNATATAERRRRKLARLTGSEP
jgi:uncharacterized protein (DUF1778 family)